jgi:hypothetical protein
LLYIKLSRYHHEGAKEERKYSSYSFLTSALDVVSGQRHTPAALYPREMTSVPIVQEAGWVSELVWTQSLEEKFFASGGDRIPVVKSVVRHCTD